MLALQLHGDAAALGDGTMRGTQEPSISDGRVATSVKRTTITAEENIGSD